MNIFHALCLGVLQGITEFLPVSSSGHLVLTQHLFGLREPQLFFDVAVHAGTLMAVFLVFRADLLQMLNDCVSALRSPRNSWQSNPQSNMKNGVKMVSMIVVGSIPTAMVGLLLHGVAERMFNSPALVGICLWITGLVLIWSSWSRPNRNHLSTPSIVDALLVGLAQGAAISPGLSRSGLTITAGLLRGLRPELTFRFSFLLSIPAIIGALFLEVYRAAGAYPEWHVVAVGFFSAFLVGWLALRGLLLVVTQGKLLYFAPYCFAVGMIAIVIAF